MLSSIVTQFIHIYIIVTVFIILFIKKKYYEYKKEEEEKENISELEYKFQFYSDSIFYLTVFKILFKNKMLTKFVDFDKMMEEALIVYDEDRLFRNECYKHGIRPRFLDYMEENKKTK